MNRDAAYLLGGAMLLGAAALFLLSDDAQAEEQPEGASVSGNGFAVNNPGNLRYIAGSNAFNGQTGQTAQGIGVYDTLQDGLRAMFLQLQEYFESGLTTISQIVTQWAPPSENPTAQYIANVANAMGINATADVSWPGEAPELMLAMIQQENGTVQGLTQQSIEQYLQQAGVYG